MLPVPGEIIYLFRHAMLREASYQLQLPGDRARLHALALEILEPLLAGHPETLDAAAGELARHAGEARRDPAILDAHKQSLHQKEVDWRIRGGTYARKRFNRLEALHQFRTVAQDAQAPAPQRVEAWVQMAEMHSAGGSIRDYRDCADRAHALALERAPEMKARTLATVAKVELREGKPEDSEAHFEEALKLAREREQLELIPRIVGNLGLIAQATDRRELAVERYEQAIEGFRQTGQLEQVVTALGNLGMMANHYGDHEQAAKYAREGLELAESLGDEKGIGTHKSNLGVVARRDGDLDAYIRLCRESMQHARRCGDIGNVAMMARAVAIGLYQRKAEGDQQEADAITREGVELASECGVGYVRMQVMLNRSRMLAWLGREDEAYDMVDEVREIGKTGDFGSDFEFRIKDTLEFIENEAG